MVPITTDRDASVCRRIWVSLALAQLVVDNSVMCASWPTVCPVIFIIPGKVNLHTLYTTVCCKQNHPDGVAPTSSPAPRCACFHCYVVPTTQLTIWEPSRDWLPPMLSRKESTGRVVQRCDHGPDIGGAKRQAVA